MQESLVLNFDCFLEKQKNHSVIKKPFQSFFMNRKERDWYTTLYQLYAFTEIVGFSVKQD